MRQERARAATAAVLSMIVKYRDSLLPCDGCRQSGIIKLEKSEHTHTHTHTHTHIHILTHTHAQPVGGGKGHKQVVLSSLITTVAVSGSCSPTGGAVWLILTLSSTSSLHTSALYVSTNRHCRLSTSD